ncbi:membrane protein [Thiomicrorhabdus immobilis]|uniref:Membrane protein n=1 Tax=Thiomicrorhabdus immobilis TaxID=2791037 RepID=A0ABM7MAQ9_9GAMM|nr:DUF808 domain-containing protein [Thiomicrorhabdus immobilis]BCN92432.1 membrane protein [Thiomicrorhabdus immobilis]
MASGIFAILDDIAMLMDDTAAMGKIAAKKTAGLLGDDLAVNAEKATGFHASRELPVLWEITKGSILNKIIILPLAFLLSYFATWLLVPILLIGGAYLSYEGAEKIYEWLMHLKTTTHQTRHTEESVSTDFLENESVKIKAAIRTDFILSIEIILIALETVIEQPLTTQILIVSLIALIATVAVYGLVALMVRMDDLGFRLQEKSLETSGFTSKIMTIVGQALVTSLPRLIRLLMIIGTIAMLLVGGGMFVHNIEYVHHLMETWPSLVSEFVAGLIVGTVIVLIKNLKKKPDHNT